MKTRGASLIQDGVFLFAAVVMAACLTAFPMAAAADVGAGSMTITAQNTSTGGSGSKTFTLTETSPGVMMWSSALETEQEILDGMGNFLGLVKLLECGYEGDPEVRLRFAVEAGDSDTVFTIPLPPNVVSFATMTNPRAQASASITATSGTTTARATGQYPGEKAYTAIYNGTTNWAYLVDSVTAGPGDSVTGSERRPVLPTVDEVILANVSSIQAAYSFKLTAGDEASGTSRFYITPEPATLGLMGLGLAMMLRRRAR